MSQVTSNTDNELIANRCHINADDCEQATKYLNACIELAEEGEEKAISFYYDRIEGLLVAAIVSYGRAFRKSKGSNNSAKLVSVDVSSVFGGDSQKIEMHEKILKYRDQAVAHSDDEFYSTKLQKVEGNTSYRKGKTVDFVGSINAELFLDAAKQMCSYFMKRGYDFDVGK